MSVKRIRVVGRKEIKIEKGKRTVVAVGGAIGSGKSTVAMTVSRSMGGLSIVKSDAIREPLFKGQKYQPWHSQAAYFLMFTWARVLLAFGKSVVLDSSFSSLSNRLKVEVLAKKFDANLLMVEVDCDNEVAEARLKRDFEIGRRDAKNAHVQDRRKFLPLFQRFTASEPRIIIDNSTNDPGGQRLLRDLENFVNEIKV